MNATPDPNEDRYEQVAPRPCMAGCCPSCGEPRPDEHVSECPQCGYEFETGA